MQKKTITCPKCGTSLEVTNPKEQDILLISCPQCQAKLRGQFNTGETVLEESPSDKKEIGSLSCKGCKYPLQLGINTIGDLAHYDQNKLISLLKSHGKMLYEYANGIDDSPVENKYDDRKGIGFSKTLEEDVEDKTRLYSELSKFSNKISLELKKRGLYARTLVVTLRYSSFKTYNHQIKLQNNTNLEEEIFKHSKIAFNKLWNLEPVRLIGLRVTNMSNNNDIQLSLFDENNKIITEKEIDKLIDDINKEFGSGTVFKGFNNVNQNK